MVWASSPQHNSDSNISRSGCCPPPPDPQILLTLALEVYELMVARILFIEVPNEHTGNFSVILMLGMSATSSSVSSGHPSVTIGASTAKSSADLDDFSNTDLFEFDRLSEGGAGDPAEESAALEAGPSVGVHFGGWPAHLPPGLASGIFSIDAEEVAPLLLVAGLFDGRAFMTDLTTTNLPISISAVMLVKPWSFRETKAPITAFMSIGILVASWTFF